MHAPVIHVMDDVVQGESELNWAVKASQARNEQWLVISRTCTWSCLCETRFTSCERRWFGDVNSLNWNSVVCSVCSEFDLTSIMHCPNAEIRILKWLHLFFSFVRFQDIFERWLIVFFLMNVLTHRRSAELKCDRSRIAHTRKWHLVNLCISLGRGLKGANEKQKLYLIIIVIVDRIWALISQCDRRERTTTAESSRRRGNKNDVCSLWASEMRKVSEKKMTLQRHTKSKRRKKKNQRSVLTCVCAHVSENALYCKMSEDLDLDERITGNLRYFLFHFVLITSRFLTVFDLALRTRPSCVPLQLRRWLIFRFALFVSCSSFSPRACRLFVALLIEIKEI